MVDKENQSCGRKHGTWALLIIGLVLFGCIGISTTISGYYANAAKEVTKDLEPRLRAAEIAISKIEVLNVKVDLGNTRALLLEAKLDKYMERAGYGPRSGIDPPDVKITKAP